MAVNVNKDTPDNTKPDMMTASLAYRQRLQCSWTKDIQWVAARGWVARPTNKSVVARLRYKSLDGGWRDDSLLRATRIRKFPRNAVMERKMLIAEKEIDCCWNPTTKEGEHSNTLNPSIPPTVEFVVVIIVQLLKRFFSFRCCFSELLATRNNTCSQQPPGKELVKYYHSLYHQH